MKKRSVSCSRESAGSGSDSNGTDGGACGRTSGTNTPAQSTGKILKVGEIRVDVEKRIHDTPKEINEFLKKHKTGTIREIAEKLDLPKTQVEHYFRTDNSRAVPSKEVWLKMKKVLNLPPTMDKIVMETYEKEMEYEMSRRVYSDKGVTPTLKAQDEGLIISLKETSERLKPKQSPTTPCYAQDSLAKHSVSQENEGGFRTLVGRFFTKYAVLPKLNERQSFSLKTLRDCLTTTGEGRLPQSFSRWMNWGMISSGRCLTANTMVCHRTGSVSLSSVLEDDVDEKYYLSDKMMERMITNEHDGDLKYIGAIMSEENEKWLEDGKEFSRNFPQGQRVYSNEGISSTISSNGGGLGGKTGLYQVRAVLTPDRPEKRQNGRRFKEDEEEMFTLTGQDKHGIQEKNRIRRLTPKECERLQGFPDNWTSGASDTQRYKMMGNAVTVNVIEAIAERLNEVMEAY